MRVLVTGGLGFIGSHLSSALLSAGHEVHMLDNSPFPPPERTKGAKFHRGSITNPKDADSAVSGCDFVFHEAAQISVADSIRNPKRTHEINVEGTQNVLEACRKHEVKRAVLASSAAVYGNAPGIPKKETETPDPISPYGESKLRNELDAKKYFKEYGLETVCLRYFNVYGPGQPPDSGIIPRLISSALHNEPPRIFGDGKQTRDFVFVEDVVLANILAAETSGVGGEVFNIGSGAETSLLSLWKTISGISGCKLAPKFEPAREGDILRSVASIEKAKAKLVYSPKYKLKDGIRKTFEFYKKQSA